MQLSSVVVSSAFIYALTHAATSIQSSTLLQVGDEIAASACAPLPESFLSYSIEFAFFPDYAGNISHPNAFSYNLLSNLGDLMGSKPIVRVGGNTQDYALYDASLEVATNGTYTNVSSDYPTILSIGKSFFESYQTWPGVRFSHGFNLASNDSAGYQTLIETVPLACEAIGGDKWYGFELGNEPDLYKTSAQGIKRPSTWGNQNYTNEWLAKSRLMRQYVTEKCASQYSYIAPSFAGTDNSLDPVQVWHDGLDCERDITWITSHNYISGATSPGVTLQGTLMNHTVTVDSIASQLNVSHLLSNYSVPFILGETNSLYNEGKPGLSNSFGAALWGMDFALWCASQGIRRVHFHQGTDYRYDSWQPVNTETDSVETRPPYYGNVAVAAMLGNLVQHKVRIGNIPLSDDREAAYAAYEDGQLKRLAIINMKQYNYTTVDASGNPGLPNSQERPLETYTFSLEASRHSSTGHVQRLMANGSDAVTGITWDAYSFNSNLNNGKPVLLRNTTSNEIVHVAGNGILSVQVPWSSAAIITLN